MELNDFKPLITEIILCISEGKYDEGISYKEW